MNYIFETNRLGFRKLCSSDIANLAEILQNPEVMYAWEHGFSREEVLDFLNKNLLRYENEGYSYFAVILKQTGTFIGVMGPLIETIEGAGRLGIAYILNNTHWNNGYAVEGAKACIGYAFTSLGADTVIAEIRPSNLPSRKVAEKLGMTVTGEFIKHYHGQDMPHLIYEVSKTEWNK